MADAMVLERSVSPLAHAGLPAQRQTDLIECDDDCLFCRCPETD
ncbi:hypothetical protein R5O87_19080 [Arthrobacter globiformis]